MYNLIVGAMDGALPVERLLEVVEDGCEDFVGQKHAPNTARLIELPTLLMPETRDSTSVQIAQVGSVIGLSKTGRQYRFRFIRNATVPPIPSERIEAAASRLHIGDWDLSRTRWSVKNTDLYQVLLEDSLVAIPSPTVFNLPQGGPEPDRISVMMPFGAAFDPVWNALKASAAEGGWTCQRADDIWQDSVVINDVVGLIACSKVVICDLTGRNANVFYETGIAHTLGREVILITQSEHDVPFDLTHHRYVKYLANSEGLAKLTATLVPRVHTLMSR